MSSHRVNPSTEVIIRRWARAIADAMKRSHITSRYEHATYPPAQNIQAQRAHGEDGVPFMIHPSEAITPTDVPGVVDYWEDGAHITTLDLREDQ